jgi:hypothetical protein
MVWRGSAVCGFVLCVVASSTAYSADTKLAPKLSRVDIDKVPHAFRQNTLLELQQEISALETQNFFLQHRLHEFANPDPSILPAPAPRTIRQIASSPSVSDCSQVDDDLCDPLRLRGGIVSRPRIDNERKLKPSFSPQGCSCRNRLRSCTL